MKDILGLAISDYYGYERDQILWVHDTHGPKVEMPITTYFRNEDKMPELELMALALCKGRILDIGAGAGSHALALEDKGMDVYAIEISPLAAEVMRQRGVTNTIEGNIFAYTAEKFDTLLLLMNGIGLTANMGGLRLFLQHAKKILQPNGQLIFDSSDVAYLYEDEGIPVLGHYYGEVTCRYEYKKQKSEWFTWLYIDQETLKIIATDEGFSTEILFIDESGQYLARLTPNVVK